MYLFKTMKVCNVILANFFLRLLRTDMVNCRDFSKDFKKSVLKNSQNLQENTSVGVSILINLHASGLQLYQGRDSKTGVFL